MPGGSGCRSDPFGPWTSTTPGLTSIFTPFGTGMIFLPIRDICQSPVNSVQPQGQLPHVTEDFTADADLLRLAARHHAARGRQDAGAKSCEHVRHIVAAEV